jgi:lipopolysaccharide/colanic/teichoic acid biosynthesis glycosyltransferase
MSTSFPLPSSSLQLETISRDVLAHPGPLPSTRWGLAQHCTATATQSTVKRMIDVVGASVGLILFSPLMLAIALAVRLSSPGPALFRQLRQGHGGRSFWFLKFRTMTADAEHRLRDLEALNEAAGGVLFKMRRDPRVTRLGRVLRRTSLDELPQLINVLRGEMSLVGPRPLQMRDSALLEQIEPEAYARRLVVLPGLTGAWQVGGRSEMDSLGMLHLDLDYIEHWSLRRDLDILGRTVGAVLRGRGAY